jgi:integrase/recombinase XerC
MSGPELAHVSREYRRYLKRNLKSRPATVNAHLTAIDHFLQFLGAAPLKAAREDLPQEAPRALDEAEQKLFLRAAAGCRRSKDKAVALLLFFTGIRIGECAALDVDDVYVAGKKNRVIVRSGKGDRYREIPLNSEAAEAVKNWLKDRRTKFEGKRTDGALFLNPQGRRMSTSSLDLIVRKIGQSRGLELSAHVLRHTLLTKLVRNGNDLMLVAEIGGHKRLETTKRYTLPTAGDKERAMEGLVE